MFKNIKHGIKWSSSKSSYIQVLHQQIRGVWGVQNYGKRADIILERSLMGGTDKVGADRLRSQVGGG